MGRAWMGAQGNELTGILIEYLIKVLFERNKKVKQDGSQ